MRASAAKLTKTKEKKFKRIKETRICADSKRYNFSDFPVFASNIATIQDYKALLLLRKQLRNFFGSCST